MSNMVADRDWVEAHVSSMLHQVQADVERVGGQSSELARREQDTSTERQAMRDLFNAMQEKPTPVQTSQTAANASRVEVEHVKAVIEETVDRQRSETAEITSGLKMVVEDVTTIKSGMTQLSIEVKDIILQQAVEAERRTSEAMRNSEERIRELIANMAIQLDLMKTESLRMGTSATPALLGSCCTWSVI